MLDERRLVQIACVNLLRMFQDAISQPQHACQSKKCQSNLDYYDDMQYVVAAIYLK